MNTKIIHFCCTISQNMSTKIFSWGGAGTTVVDADNISVPGGVILPTIDRNYRVITLFSPW